MSNEPFTDDQVETAMDLVDEFLDKTLTALAVDEDFTDEISYENGEIHVEFDGSSDDVALVIGKRGQTLDAMQYLCNALLISRTEELVPVRIDAHGYRRRREEQLQKQADQAVGQVLRTGESVELDPMTSSERKVIHLFLKSKDGVTTESEGREPNRRLVIHPE